MSDTTVLRDGEGNYYTFAPDVLAAARGADGAYELDGAAVEAARVPAEAVAAVESALPSPEVSGYAGVPVPGIDVIVRKRPGGRAVTFTDLGLRTVPYGEAGAAYR